MRYNYQPIQTPRKDLYSCLRPRDNKRAQLDINNELRPVENCDDEWTFQQDGALGHKAIETQNFIRANCPDFILVDTHWRNNDGEWPPNSIDLNPLDYSVKSILEEKACAKPHPNLESLKRALKKAWNEITLETLIKIVNKFPKRLKACMDAKGGHFE
uniref:Transposase n=1 Tax=Acrobeloides nanus TaxID=290746 RepID=A0A914E6S4_9BILA